ncbi:MAG: hypothetical protein DMG13_30390 [Acidobacteria bacterium]|nr:MAG: hypothetical protein DMG13_30390 [Acidobacteriota bacterium]
MRSSVTFRNRCTILLLMKSKSLAIAILLIAFAAHGLARERAPRFNAMATTGEKFNNESIKGKVVLLEFWASWCGYCETERPFIERLNDEFDGKGLLVLAINVGESKNTVKKYLDKHPRKTRVVLTNDTNLAAMYAATSYPIYVVLDRDGNIAATQRGAAGEEALRALVARAGLDGIDSAPKDSR